ncbi:hypothetical protein B0H17DRAFT_1125571 [Mycena rosella]|uniref:Uncharacterized protein n=1 Tax=Mycena rosella TaxID=1033263 RepID=A0AAD7M9K4_MYCRO|nr:hypothetical protein B0H17DRAFT_1125571 [Mycena rosella]
MYSIWRWASLGEVVTIVTVRRDMKPAATVITPMKRAHAPTGTTGADLPRSGSVLQRHVVLQGRTICSAACKLGRRSTSPMPSNALDARRGDGPARPTCLPPRSDSPDVRESTRLPSADASPFGEGGGPDTAHRVREAARRHPLGYGARRAVNALDARRTPGPSPRPSEAQHLTDRNPVHPLLPFHATASYPVRPPPPPARTDFPRRHDQSEWPLAAPHLPSSRSATGHQEERRVSSGAWGAIRRCAGRTGRASDVGILGYARPCGRLFACEGKDGLRVREPVRGARGREEQDAPRYPFNEKSRHWQSTESWSMSQVVQSWVCGRLRAQSKGISARRLLHTGRRSVEAGGTHWDRGSGAPGAAASVAVVESVDQHMGKAPSDLARLAGFIRARWRKGTTDRSGCRTISRDPGERYRHWTYSACKIGIDLLLTTSLPQRGGFVHITEKFSQGRLAQWLRTQRGVVEARAGKAAKDRIAPTPFRRIASGSRSTFAVIVHPTQTAAL